MRYRIPPRLQPINSGLQPLLRGLRFTMRPFHSPAAKRKTRDNTTEAATE